MKNFNYLLLLLLSAIIYSCTGENTKIGSSKRAFNGKYENEYLNRVAFPIGGIGAGMFCIEGSGAISHVSVRNHPEIFNEPCMFAALHIKGLANGTKLLEGQSPEWKRFGLSGSGNGLGETSWGLPRFKENTFLARFPFAEIELRDKDLPVDVKLKAWSPFIPTDEDNSCLPVGAIEYEFHNKGNSTVDAIFSYTSKNFMAINRRGVSTIKQMTNGFILSQTGTNEEPHLQGDFVVFTDNPSTKVDYCLFRGGWFDPLTISWNDISTGVIKENEPVESGAPGASLYVPVQLKPGEKKTINLYIAWYVPLSNMKIGGDAKNEDDMPNVTACCADPNNAACCSGSDNASCCAGSDNSCCSVDDGNYRPWYSSRFKDIEEVSAFWLKNYNDLKSKSQLFTDAFYACTLPAEVIEAVAANLTIIKSPTVLRQFDGRMWAWEGCNDNSGCCHGTCTHVWNYAQAIPHLFPALERTLRETEFMVSQNKAGHQTFRTNLPIRPVVHDFHSAADGQLGGIMKAYREWRIYGKTEWLKKFFPNIKQSIEYCISVWDPRETGALEEPRHNTYDIEFWGPDGMCTSFYTGALQAVILMGKELGEDVSRYENLMAKSKEYMENKLYDGEYFIQDIRWKDLSAPDPTKVQTSYQTQYTPESFALLEKEGPKYQYGTGCLSDGILGSWISLVCCMPEVIDRTKITSHLLSVYKYNLKKNLLNHANPQRPTFAMGDDGGLLLCSWPKGGKLQLPFVYSDEVWTGIEYQVASHLMFHGEIEKGLEIVRICRNRYNGIIRNPFNEYECGSWYARAMASYGMIEGLTGVRYDAVDGILYIDSRIGNSFTSFISTNTGFGIVGLKNGKPFIDVKYGTINIKKCLVSGKPMSLRA